MTKRRAWRYAGPRTWEDNPFTWRLLVWIPAPSSPLSFCSGNLYITEDNGPGEIWVVGTGGGQPVRFASLSDCSAEPTGIYFDRSGKTLWVNVQHAGGPLSNDLAVAITRE